MTLLAGVTLRHPGIPRTEVWDPEAARRLVLEAVQLEAHRNRQIPRQAEEALNAAVTRRDLVAVRAWVQRIARALDTVPVCEATP